MGRSHKGKTSPIRRGWDIVAKLLAADPHCAYCRRRLNKHSATKDHKIPKSRGGSNDISNIALACATCNVAKGDRTVSEFLEGR